MKSGKYNNDLTANEIKNKQKKNLSNEDINQNEPTDKNEVSHPSVPFTIFHVYSSLLVANVGT